MKIRPLQKTALAGLATVVSLSGCLFMSSCAPPEQAEPAKSEPAVLRIDGSNGVRPLAAALLEAFAKAHPEIEVTLGEGMGSSDRLDALAAGEIDIATASHGLDAADLAERELVPYRFARMAIVFAVHDSVSGVESLGLEQIKTIYTTPGGDWSEYGGAPGRIAKLMRPDHEVDAEKLREFPELAEAVWSEDTEIIESSGELARALNSTEQAIGITTLSRADGNEHIKPIAFEGISASEENLKTGKYPLTRDSFLVVRKSTNSVVEAFLNFLETPAAQQSLRNSSAVPISLEKGL